MNIEEVLEKFSELGFTGLNSKYFNSWQKILCPKCSATRKHNPNELCLGVNVKKGLWHCHNCSDAGSLGISVNDYSGSEYKKGRGKGKVKKEWMEAVHADERITAEEEPINRQVQDFISDRGLNEGVSIHLESGRAVTMRKWKSGGKPLICFNYYLGNKLINIKYRGVEKKSFGQIRGADAIPWNVNSLIKINSEKNNEVKICLITEGEFDSLALLETFSDGAIISLDKGAINEDDKKTSGKLACIDNVIEHFSNIHQIYLFMDNDAAGKRTEYELAKKLGWKKCFVVTYPEGCKDANDVLKTFGTIKGTEILQKMVLDAKPHELIEEEKKYRIVNKFENWLLERHEFVLNELDTGIYWRIAGSNEHYKPFSRDFDLPALHREAEDDLDTTALYKDLIWRSIIYNAAPWNPIRDYLNSLEWDGVDHFQDLYDSISTDDDKWFAQVFPKWYVGIIAKFYEKYETNNGVLILQGDQGSGKTYFLSNLLPKLEYWELTQVKPQFHPDDKDERFTSYTSLLIIMDEMASYSKGDLNSLKSYLTAKSYRDRKVHGYDYHNYKICSSFCGCTNPVEFLRDDTGDRRYLVFEDKGRDRDLFDAVDKEQLLAQAVKMYRDGFDYRIKDSKEIMKRNLEKFSVVTPDEQILSEVLFPSISEKYTRFDLNMELLERYSYKLVSNNTKFGQIMKKLGIEKRTEREGSKTSVFYYCTFDKNKQKDKRIINRLNQDLPDGIRLNGNDE